MNSHLQQYANVYVIKQTPHNSRTVMLFKQTLFLVSLLCASAAILPSYKLQAQGSKDTSTCLTRYKVGATSSYKIPMTKFCFVSDAGLSKDYSNGWIMKWDVIKKANSNLLFMEMNSTDVDGWLGNENVSGSVQLVFELPAFSDSIALENLTYKSRGVYAINNYGGGTKKEYLNGNLRITRHLENIIISSSLNLITENPKTKQQFILINNPVQSFTFHQYQEFENERDSVRKAEKDLLINPYTGKFRFRVSAIDKAGYTRITYSINEDSIVIKEGPYDSIYLAKNYSGDSVYYKRALNKNEKTLLANIGQRIESDTLKTSYTNFCIIDGLILSFSFESSNFYKDVTVSNYYNESIANVVGFINKITPKKYRLWYDKKILLIQQSECNK